MLIAKRNPLMHQHLTHEPAVAARFAGRMALGVAGLAAAALLLGSLQSAGPAGASTFALEFDAASPSPIVASQLDPSVVPAAAPLQTAIVDERMHEDVVDEAAGRVIVRL